MYALFLLFVIGLTHFVPTLTQNATNNGKRQYIIPDGGQIQIQCIPNNTNATITTWKVFGEPINGDLSNFNISENSTLIVTNPRNSSLQGLVNVTCIIASSNNTNFSRIIEVVFFKAPKITNTKLIYDVPDDGSTKTTFSCDATGFPQPEIQWMLGKVTLPTGTTYPVNITDVPNANLTASNDGSLEVMSNNRDGGFGVDVVCFANNTDGNTEENFLVRFLKAPKILSTMFDIAIPSGLVDYVWIPCQTLGYPRPLIEWVFENVRINARSPKLDGEECLTIVGLLLSSYKVYENGSLLIDNPYCAEQVPHENFTCVASSFLGVDTQSHAFSIGKLMTFPFEIILVNASQFGNRAGVVAKIESAVFKDGTNSLSLRSMNVTFVNVTSGMVRFVLTWLEQRLEKKDYIVTINSKDRVNTAKLARDVRNKLKENGVDVVYFFIDAKPGPATDLSVTGVAEKEISFSWTKPDYFAVEYYQIQTNDGGGSNWDNRAQAPGDKTNFVLDGLDSGTKYLIRMESVNNKGTGIPSEHVQAKTDDSVPVVIIVVVVILVVLVVIAVVLGVRYYRHKPTRDDLVVITMDDNNPYFLSIPGVQTTNIYERDNRTFCPFLGGDLQVNLGADEKEYFSWREIARDSLQMGDALGEGEFGMVVKAMWMSEEEKTPPLPVAVKTIKDNATDTDRKELFKELKLMAEISEHPNIVKMIGACSKGGPLWIIVELCEHGNLLNFLRKNRQEISGKTGDFTSSLDPLLRVRIAFNVAKGMHYLEDKKIVHRDLAARNVLLGKNKIAKIADFGLSRDIYEQGMYTKQTGGKLPVKWMAIESLKDQAYDSKSDVWSYGVLFWEIESAGMVPYPGVGGRDVLGFLLNGFRLDKPSETPFEIYEIMKKCWEPSPKVRPHFKEIESELEAYLEERADYLPVMIDEDQGDHEEAYINYIVGIEDDETPNDTTL